jgi:FG-GAP repeat protein
MSIPLRFSHLYPRILFASVAALFAQNLYAQGGAMDPIYQVNGGSVFESLGQALSDAGDVDGDGVTDFIVGSLYADPAGMEDAGSAYVYSGATGSLIYQFDGSADYDNFGSAVACAGDVNADGFDDVIIGAYSASNGAVSYSGKAYVYSGATGLLLHEFGGQYFYDQFGAAVSTAGDYDGDGIDDVLIGAPSAVGVNNFPDAGSVYIYSGNDGTLLKQFLGANHGDYLGKSVGVADIDGSGSYEIILGAHGADPNGNINAGTVYFYSSISGSLIMAIDGTEAQQYLGRRVADAGDTNGDGADEVIIGAHGTTHSGQWGAGSAFVYSGTGTLIRQFDGTVGEQYLGMSVDGAGDVDGDGTDDLIIGAIGDSSQGIYGAGSALVYSGATGALIMQDYGSADSEWFGESVSGLGDVNGDGKAEFMVGALYASPGGVLRAGSAYVFEVNPIMTSSSSTISAAAGGVLSLNLNFPDAAAGQQYKVLISRTGAGPTFYGVDIPLTMDSLVMDTYFGSYPFTTYTDLQGVLDIKGAAIGSITIPAGAYGNLVGLTVYMAAIANQAGGLPEYSSVAVPITIVS